MASSFSSSNRHSRSRVCSKLIGERNTRQAGIDAEDVVALAVAAGFTRDAESGMSDAGAEIALAASRQMSSRFTLSTSAFMSVLGSSLPQRMFSARNQRS